MLSGTICSLVIEGNQVRFNLRTVDGVFAVRVNLKQARIVGEPLCQASEVCLIGRPKAYYHRQRRTNLVYVEALLCWPAQQPSEEDGEPDLEA